MKSVTDIMTRDVATLSAESTIREAVELFSTNHLSGVPVMSGERVVGVISMSDVLGFLLTVPEENEPEVIDTLAESLEGDGEADDEDSEQAGFSEDLWTAWESGPDTSFEDSTGGAGGLLDQHTVEEAMTGDVIAVSPRASVKEAAATMARHGIHRVLVMDGTVLKGIVSALDITRAVGTKGGATPV
jgi:CBS domain-containing protein